ncbi:hypothetical protein K504DRAFT_132788 [Pleomassaria siparia CBS 279.74]|uniref:Exocyst complex protein EXO70 n=1 Tax=Pleomassaria siparia CBS 279.74 TaxID=1314801 RepID=A0A6G1KK18_9PLEO|nr:hypothetical protein K504DRAFT_132788 [Pleomassaria siparia CBS 279.74]
MVAPRKGAYAEESAEVEVLFANMEKMKSLTKKIQGSLNRLETSGKTVQEAIGPIYGNTQRLQVTNANIVRIIDAIDRVRAPLDETSREERIIKAGPRNSNLQDYVGSLQRTTMSLSKLRQTNLRSNQQVVNDLSNLLTFGNKQLEQVFRDLLREGNGKTVEPLEYVAKNNPFPVFTDEKISTLRSICSHMSTSFAQLSPDAREAPTHKIYAEIRGEYLTKSLRTLAAASINTTKKMTEGAVYAPGTNGIGYYAKGMEGLFIAEYTNLSFIFPQEECGLVFTATCQSSLTEFNKTLRELNGYIQKNLTTDCFLGYEIIGIVSKLSMQMEKDTGELKRPIYDSLKPIRETCKASLGKLMEDTRTRVQTLVALPADGAQVPVTTETMTRLQNMTSYLDPLSSILTSLGDGGWSTTPAAASTVSLPDVGADGQKLFASYASDTIEALLMALERRSSFLLKGKNLQGVFLANNIFIVDKLIRTSDLGPLMAGYAGKLEAWKKRASSAYLDAWREPSACLLDVQYTNRSGRPHSGGAATADSTAIVKGLSSKDKDAIKEKFKNFNMSFDELVAKHKGFKMEREVRTLLGREVQTILEPLYGRFWDRYHEIDKGKGKYVKYDKTQLGSTLAGLS